MAKVRWTRRALDDLSEIHSFIAKDSRRAAESLSERIVATADHLGSFPELGRRVPEFPDSPYRELIVTGYRILYRATPEAVWIAAIVHGRRQLERAFHPDPA